MKIYINETEINVVPPKEFSTMLFVFLFQDSKYMSFDALVVNVEKLIDTVEEYIDVFRTEADTKDVAKRELPRMHKILNQWRIRLRKTCDRDALLEWIYSTILTLEGLSLFRGY